MLSMALMASVLAGGSALAQDGEEKPGVASINLNYGSFSTPDADVDGNQALTYAQVAYETERWGAAAAGSFASTSYRTELHDDRFTVSALMDSVLSAFYKTRLGGVSVRAGADVNVPTGKNAFPSEELRRVVTDDIREDLQLVNIYGGGLNITPHAVFTYKSGPVTWGAAFRYIFTGEYDPTSDIEGDDFDPGDRLTGVGSALVDMSGAGKILLTATYSRAGADKQGGREVFRNGDVTQIEARYMRGWTESLKGTLGVVFSTQGKNERLGDGDVLQSETGNANGNSLEFFTLNVYSYSSRALFTGVAGYKTVDENGYSEGEPFHDAGRSLFYLEPGGAFYLRDDLYFAAKVRYTRISDKKDSFSPKDAAYDVFNVDAGFVYSF